MLISYSLRVAAKDISAEQSGQERGKVAGTAVGCACGDGVIDWQRIIEICRWAPRDIVCSVEYGTKFPYRMDRKEKP